MSIGIQAAGVTLLDGTKQLEMEYVIEGSIKVWADYDISSGTPVTLKSFNVSSVIDNGAGSALTGMTNLFADANYSVSGASCDNSSLSSIMGLSGTRADKTIAAIPVRSWTTSGGAIDRPILTFMGIGDLA